MKELIESISLRRHVLVVDDEVINREILGSILGRIYDVSYAENGRQACEMLREDGADYALVLLDLMMPVMDGVSFLEARQNDPKLHHIPVIVMTSEREAEVRSIRCGAADFIAKPFESPEVVVARCERIIELFEGKSIIRSTEKDSLTGLYSREFFFEYIRKIAPHFGNEMDAVVLDVDHFHLINDLFGRREGDRILASIARQIDDALQAAPGMACRLEADTYYILSAHRQDWSDVLSRMQTSLSTAFQSARVRLRMGVYQKVEQGQIAEVWFDRAKQACARIRGDYMHPLEFYSSELYERAVFHERLIRELQTAIDEKHLVVYYQPKYDVRGEEPHLVSAEALIRWQHPEMGMICPGEFIPLFESNGLIQTLDRYVWRETAAQIRQWKEKFGFSLPVSVNVSRVDVYDPDLENRLLEILDACDLSSDELMLEITESAYADNASHLVRVVESIRDKGFRIEMDDFGSGYSSLNMLTSIPIDVLKMDISFTRNMLRDSRTLKLVELVLDISRFLGVPVVAEGVENEEQLRRLKEMGCGIIQGFYFSRPVPPDEFEPFICREIQSQIAK